jgi:predicted lipid-binding transport protein (Tim44 family)
MKNNVLGTLAAGIIAGSLIFGNLVFGTAGLVKNKIDNVIFNHKVNK